MSKNLIVIVDDEPVVQRGLEAVIPTLLGEFNFDLSSYLGGKKLIQLMREGFVKPTVVLMDYDLKDLDGKTGPDFIKEIMEIDPTVPVIGMSFSPERYVQEEFFESGAKEFFYKGMETSKWIELVKKFLTK